MGVTVVTVVAVVVVVVVVGAIQIRRDILGQWFSTLKAWRTNKN